MTSRGELVRSVATASMGDELPRRLEAAALAGFDAVELRERDLITCSRRPQALGRLAATAGVRIDAYQPFVLRRSESPERLDRRATAKLDLTAALGASSLVVHAADLEGDLSWTEAALQDLAGLAVERGVRLAVRPAAGVGGWDVLARLVRAASHDGLGLCVTSDGWLAGAIDVADLVADRVANVQLSGIPLFSLAAQRGVPNPEHRLVEMVAALVAAGYHGPFTMEAVNDLDESRHAERGAADAMRLLLSLEDGARAALAGDPTVDPAAARLLSMTPASPEPSGYAFVELAADEGGTGLAGSALRHLGFTPAGRHRSKPVERWVQGPVSVLVTTDRSRRADDGVTVAALGIESMDPSSASRRARHLRAYPHHRQRAGDEAEMPLFASPDGSSLLFCRPAAEPGSWPHDFVEDPSGVAAAAEVAGLGIDRVDHVALTVDRDRFDEAVLFYRSVVGLSADELVELPWSSRATRSRALCTGDRGLRLVLNARRGRSEGEHAPAPEHIAFSCRDVVAAARALRLRPGGFYLPVPDNYYDDLLVRTTLPDARVEQLREAGVLFDEDAGGQFLHLFTPLVGDRLFLELVQRLDGYDGYGAPNTPLRTTAHRLRRI